MNYEDIREVIYKRWEDDECEGIHEEILTYVVLTNTLRWVMGMDDEKITKQAIYDIAKHFVNSDPEIIETAKELSDCFEEVI